MSRGEHTGAAAGGEIDLIKLYSTHALHLLLSQQSLHHACHTFSTTSHTHTHTQHSESVRWQQLASLDLFLESAQGNSRWSSRGYTRLD